jgi:large subunit ribosomal protein L23
MATISNKTEKKEAKTSAKTVVSSPILQSVLVKPRISEKSAALANSGKYVFVVTGSSNKVEVKKAIETTYKVRVTQVNIVVNKGKTRNFGRTAGKTSGFKKAIVTLRKGDKIEGATETI